MEVDNTPEGDPTENPFPRSQPDTKMQPNSGSDATTTGMEPTESDIDGSEITSGNTGPWTIHVNHYGGRSNPQQGFWMLMTSLEESNVTMTFVTFKNNYDYVKNCHVSFVCVL